MKALPPTCLLATLGLMVGLHFAAPLAPLVRGLWLLLGLAPLGMGVALNLSADAALRQAQTTVKPDQTPQALVTQGAFRISRNPMYLGFVFIVLGVAILLGTAVPMLVVPPFAALLDWRYIRPEERVLEQTFGPQWTEYAHRVGRWI